MSNQHFRFLEDHEIVADFINRMSDEDKKSWSFKSTELIQGHHGVGRYVRNYYRFWEEENPYKGDKHPDDRSMEILIEIWKKLNPTKPYEGYY